MFSQSVKYYDIIYSKIKNYDEECDKIARQIKDAHPSAKTILDVGCGTGEHARILSKKYDYFIDGIDIEPEFIELAKQKNLTSNFEQADMTNFNLHKQYDVVLCLFSSIGYVKTLKNVTKCLKIFKEHLTNDGIIIVEPWFQPKQWNPGKVYSTYIESNDIYICRMGYSKNAVNNISRFTFEYLVGSNEGIKYFQENHELGLFTINEMKSCFKQAALKVEYDSEGIFNRGLYLAKHL